MGASKKEGMNAGDDFAADAARADSYKSWHEKSAGKFCVGFLMFVIAETLVYVTLHWIFPII